MINLLPPINKEELRQEGNKKLTVVLGSTTLLSLTSLLLVLFAVKFYILADSQKYSQMLIDAQKKYQTPEFLLYKGVIEASNKDLTAANLFYKNEMRASEALKNLLLVKKPSGIRLTNIHIGREKETNSIMVSIAGVSDERESLLAFKEGLESNVHVKNLDFPADNWVRPQNIVFRLAFKHVN